MVQHSGVFATTARSATDAGGSRCLFPTGSCVAFPIFGQAPAGCLDSAEELLVRGGGGRSTYYLELPLQALQARVIRTRHVPSPQAIGPIGVSCVRFRGFRIHRCIFEDTDSLLHLLQAALEVTGG